MASPGFGVMAISRTEFCLPPDLGLLNWCLLQVEQGNIKRLIIDAASTRAVVCLAVLLQQSDYQKESSLRFSLYILYIHLR
jgi:hypothetical protein